MSDLIERLEKRCTCVNRTYGKPCAYCAAADALEQKDKRIAELEVILDKVHRYAVHQWGEGKMDGWLKIMELTDPGLRIKDTT